MKNSVAARNNNNQTLKTIYISLMRRAMTINALQRLALRLFGKMSVVLPPQGEEVASSAVMGVFWFAMVLCLLLGWLLSWLLAWLLAWLLCLLLCWLFGWCCWPVYLLA